MIKKGGFLLLFIVVAASLLNAQKPEDALAYTAGERLELIVSYRSKLIKNADMGSVVMSVSEDKLRDTAAFKIEAYGSVFGLFRWFYKLDDYYYSWTSRESLLPMKAQAEINEGSYRFSSEFIYDWKNMVSYNRWRNHRKPNESLKVLQLVDGAMDGLSLFYNLRSTDIRKHKPGDEIPLTLMLEDTIRVIKCKYFGPEIVDVPKLGKINALKLSCQLATSEGESFEDGSEFYIWISNDRNKIPLLIESPVKVGSIRARLVSYKGLKYPKDSVLK